MNTTSVTTLVPTLIPTPILTQVSSSVSTQVSTLVLTRPNKRFVKASDIINLFTITKSEYNNILVRINKIILNNFII